MRKGMYVTYDGSVYQVVNMQGATRGRAGMPVPSTIYTLDRVDVTDTAATSRLTLTDPMAADLPSTPPCSCGLRPGFCHGIHPAGFRHDQPYAPGDVVRFLYLTDQGVHRWGSALVRHAFYRPMTAPVVDVVAPEDALDAFEGLLTVRVDDATRTTDPRAVTAAHARASAAEHNAERVTA